MASAPKMPRGTSRCGLRVSSAAVATTSKPMNAKNAMLAAVSRPSQPKLVPPVPVSQASIDWCTPSAFAEGSAAGMKGVRFDALK